MTNIAPISTINDLFRRVSAAANPRAVLWQDEFAHWQPISSDQIYQRVRAVAQALLAWGAKKGDRIAIIAENRWEWAVTDFATLAIGAANVPIYPTLTGEQIATLVNDAGCHIVFVSTRQQFDKLNSVRALTQLERIVIMDSPAPDGAISFSALMDDADVLGSQRDPVFDALVPPPSRRTWRPLSTHLAPPASPRALPLPTATSPQTRTSPPPTSASTPPTPASPSCPSRTSRRVPSTTSCTTRARRWCTARNSTSCPRPCAKSAPPSSWACPAFSRRSARQSSKNLRHRPSRNACSPGPSASARILPISSTTAAVRPL